MKTKIVLGIATILILAIGLTCVASNMGFKISIPFSANVSKYVSIPFYNNYTTAATLRNDIMSAAGYTPPYPTGIVTVFNWNGTVWQKYAGGGIGQVNFNMTSGLGYQVKSTVDVSNWIVVGSHNPTLSIGFSANVSKYVSTPYHTTSTTAATLRNELMAAAGYSTPYPTGIITVFNWNGTTWQKYAGGGIGQVNFNITPGLAHQVKSTVDIASWTPAHY